MSKEQWKNVDKYDGLYMVSNLGNIKSLERTIIKRNGAKVMFEEKILKNSLTSSGYLGVSLSKNGVRRTFRNHVLVAISFLNHEPNGHKLIVDHINDNKTDNRVDNLRVISQRKNLSRRKNTSSKHPGVHYQKSSGKWISQISINKKHRYLGIFDSEKKAEEAYNNELIKIQ